MNANKIFRLNEIDKNTVQIYGLINGIARRIFVEGRPVCVCDIRFFKNDRLYKISNHHIRSLSSMESLEEEILRIYNEEN